MTKIALGLMSGTSADGLTVCAICPAPFRILHFRNYPYPPALQQKLLKAFTLTAPALSRLHYELGSLYARYTQRFLKDFLLRPADIAVIGSHGQTVYHGPHDTPPNTLQLGEPSFLAGALHVPVVSDFRAKDIALGGQGAPLMPFFDHWFFGKKSPKILLNLGGIANFTLVGKGIVPLGFDAGPGNTLIDLCAQRFFKKPFDKNGTLAAKGTPDKQKVNRLLRQSFFKQKPPKSLDKNAFGTAYLERFFLPSTNPHDLLATVTWFTAAAVADQINRFVPLKNQREIIVSGGGCYNATLMRFLQDCLPHMRLTTVAQYGIDPQAKEAAAFALFAWLTLHKKINHCARATGAAYETVLGKITL